jgi:hypothetical protein
MNASLLEPVRWSRRRWVCAVTAVFALQAGLVICLGRRGQPLSERPIFRTAVYLVADEQSAEQLANLPGLDDPTLFALPNLRGFSGPAWLQFASLDYQPGEWSEPPHWLELRGRALGSTFSQFVETNTVSPLLMVDRPLPPLLRYEPNFPNEPVPPESRLRIEGELTARPLLFPLSLKSWTHSEILSNSVVQMAVNADGFTFSTLLLSECGLKEADLYALKLAGDARFRPLPRERRVAGDADSLMWGKLVFQWHTLPLTTTNVSPPEP